MRTDSLPLRGRQALWACVGGNTLLAPGWPRFRPAYGLLDWRSHFCFPALLAIAEEQ